MQKIGRTKGAVPLLVVGAIALLSRTNLPQWLSETFQAATYTPSVADSEHMLVVPGSVYDGDTLRVGRDGQELKIRLCGIDAPERDQSLGIESRDYLRALLDQNPQGKVIIVPVEEDQYGRTVAELFLWPDDDASREISINSEMLMAGMAYVYPQYVDGCPNGEVFKQAETIGQEAKAGVWAGNNQRPWEYRR